MNYFFVVEGYPHQTDRHECMYTHPYTNESMYVCAHPHTHSLIDVDSTWGIHSVIILMHMHTGRHGHARAHTPPEFKQSIQHVIILMRACTQIHAHRV